MRKNSRLAILMGLGLMLMSGLALAQQVQTVSIDQIGGATKAGDWSMQIWQSIFGTFATNPFSPGMPNTLLGNLFVTFNAAVFAIGTAWLGYGVVSGIIGTTQDGQALGQRINSSWYPIRVVTGVGGMLPIMGGYTVSQAMLMSVAALGIGTANLMWTTAVTSPGLNALVQSEAIASRQVLNRADVMDAAATMFKAHVCLVQTQRQMQEAQSAGATLGPRDQLVHRGVDIANGTKIQYGTVADPESCGSVSFTMASVRRETNAFAYRINSVNYEGIRSSAISALSGKLLSLDEKVKVLADEYIARVDAWNRADNKSDGPDFDPKALTRLVDGQLAETQAAVRPLVDGKTAAVTDFAQSRMLASGWMGAGSFYGTFAEANAALADAVTGGRLTTRQPSEARIFSEAAVEVNRASKYVEQVARNDAKTAVFCGGSTLTSFIGTDSGNCSLGQGIVSAVMGATMRGSGGGAGVFGGADDVGLVNPIVGMKNAGDYIMTVANVLILYDRANNAKIDTDEGFGDAISNGIGKVGATAAKKIPVIGTLLDELAPFGWMLLALGAMLAIYIPFLPLIAWVGGMIAYTASFIEGLVAMPLHSMSHMHTDGEGMGQQTSHGYLFFLNTFARPPLMVIAFFIAGGLVIALGTVATMMFLPAMANVQGNSMTSVASIIGFIVIYFVLMNIIINGCFDLIHVIPDQVIGFVGSGSVNTSLGRDAEGKINALYMAGVRGGQGAGQANIQRANQRAFQSNQAVRGKANLSEGDGGRK